MKRIVMFGLAALVLATSGTALARGHFDEHQAPRTHGVEDIQAPRTHFDEIQAPRGEQEEIQAPRAEEIQAPRGSE